MYAAPDAPLLPSLAYNTSQTLTVFLDAALSKKYTNPSSDIIAVLTGLDNADAVLADFVATLDAVIRNGRHCGCIIETLRGIR
jgi:hypothetical protein